jgi:hypothetical protein
MSAGVVSCGSRDRALRCEILPSCRPFALCRLSQENTDADGVSDRCAAKRNAMVRHKNRKGRSEGAGERYPFAVRRDQSDIVNVPRQILEIVRINRKRLQRIDRRRVNGRMEGVRMGHDHYVGARSKYLGVNRPLGMTATLAH